ncbi:hypothetical protein N7462_005503 [Penicillium macrosclerotiorum]|uniref:uncharacterized protein n=1 Tax=Penicillium macrosclerotiorum TaxID=303699 RepID=UPI00254759B5|nr:uncharacterized protein N7462_005503 [Penicillium macrosclerotiorum]KAJ5682338.1 hypothetical protein N7462_005503 [Penicillium macrosclerotiorum]
MDFWNESNGPPRKKMRKGTKSCTECRRRKIRCTFTPGRLAACNECRLRGSICIDQENTSDDPTFPTGSGQGDQRYSLRERVAHLENVVQDLAKRLDQQTAAVPSAEAPGTDLEQCLESDQLGPSSDQIQSAPVLQLFDNYLVSRREDSSSNDRFTGAKDMSPKARAVRAELLSLFPCEEDIYKIFTEGFKLWCIWDDVNLPDLGIEFKLRAHLSQNTIAPAEIAKALVCFSVSVIQSPPEFDFGALRNPIDPQEFAARCTAAVDRLVVRDDDFAATLPGIECQMLLSKFHLNEGRLRKAWLVNRRAIEFAHLAGMHLSTRTPRPSDGLFERRLKLWCALTTTDRSLSLILGLPYGVSEAFYLPQIERRLKSTTSPAEPYLLRMGVITGHMVDRNQNPAEMCLETTLKLDQELMDAWKAMPNSFYGTEPGPNESREHFYERVPLQFMPKVLRALLHLPFMLKYPFDPRFSYCHQIAIQSAREGLVLYKVLRSITRSYLCKMIDFLAFTMGMLLIVHLHGQSEESSEPNKTRDEQDWKLVGEVVGILREASSECGGSVAAESANILGAIFHTRSQKRNWTSLATCKVTVPYFGTITVGAGAKFLRPKDQDPGIPNPLPSATASSKPSPNQLCTPPISDSDGASTCHSNTMNPNTPILGANGATGYPLQPLSQGDDLVPNTFAGLESNTFTGLFDDFGQFTWPSPDVDLGLDHGWNLNWFE